MMQIILYLLILALLLLPLGVIKSQEGKMKLKISLLGYVLLFWFLLIVVTLLYGYIQIEALQEVGTDEHMSELFEKHTQNNNESLDVGYSSFKIYLSFFLSTSYVLGWLYGLIYYMVFMSCYLFLNLILGRKKPL